MKKVGWRGEAQFHVLRTLAQGQDFLEDRMVGGVVVRGGIKDFRGFHDNSDLIE